MHIAGEMMLQPDRKTPPAFQGLTVPTLARPVTEFLSNGIEVSRFFSETQHLISAEFLFPASNLETRSRELDGLVFKMLTEGTRSKKAKEIADSISYWGASLECTHQPDFNIISISCLSRHFSKILNLLSEIWEEASFPEKEWNTLKETQLHQLEINLQKTSYRAGRLLRKTLYGSTWDYGYSLDPEVLSGFHPEVLRKRHQEIVKTGPALVLLAGNADAATLQQLYTWLGNFERTQPVLRQLTSPLAPVAASIQWDSPEEAKQASLRMGQLCINSQHPDSALFSFALEIYGGYFGSRLMSNIREDKGWTYGIYAQRIGNVAQPYWTIGADVKGEVSMDAVNEIHKEARLLREEAVPEEELEIVRNYMLGQFLSSITNVYGLAEKYRAVWIQGTSFDRTEQNQKIIQSATAEDVLRMANLYLHTENMVVALSGPEISHL